MEQDDPKRGFPVPLHDVVNTLLRHNLDHDLSWWLAHLDRKVWELEQRVKALEKGYDLG